MAVEVHNSVIEQLIDKCVSSKCEVESCTAIAKIGLAST